MNNANDNANRTEHAAPVFTHLSSSWPANVGHRVTSTILKKAFCVILNIQFLSSIWRLRIFTAIVILNLLAVYV